MKPQELEIQSAVRSEIEWDVRMHGAEVEIDVDGGVVILRGAVSGWSAHQAARDAAHRVRGVLDVANLITVKQTAHCPRSDAEIARAARDALSRRLPVAGLRIHATTSHGQVILEGNVESWCEREAAESAIHGIAGVCQTVNRVEVMPASVPPNVLEDALEEALERQARRQARHIQVRMLDGSVTLTGVVRSWHEREAVVGAMKATPGVRRVESRLSIEPFPTRVGGPDRLRQNESRSDAHGPPALRVIAKMRTA